MLVEEVALLRLASVGVSLIPRPPGFCLTQSQHGHELEFRGDMVLRPGIRVDVGEAGAAIGLDHRHRGLADQAILTPDRFEGGGRAHAFLYPGEQAGEFGAQGIQ